MAVPSAEAGNDPGERVARVGILPTRGFAFEGCANGFGGRQQGGIDDIGMGGGFRACVYATAGATAASVTASSCCGIGIPGFFSRSAN